MPPNIKTTISSRHLFNLVYNELFGQSLSSEALKLNREISLTKKRSFDL